MNDSKSQEARDVRFEEVVPTPTEADEHLEIKDLKKVCLTLTADLGKCTMLVRDVLELKRGSVVALDKLAGEMMDIYANGIPLAKGEVVVIADTLHVRIADIIGASETDLMSGLQSED